MGLLIFEVWERSYRLCYRYGVGIEDLEFFKIFGYWFCFRVFEFFFEGIFWFRWVLFFLYEIFYGFCFFLGKFFVFRWGWEEFGYFFLMLNFFLLSSIGVGIGYLVGSLRSMCLRYLGGLKWGECGWKVRRRVRLGDCIIWDRKIGMVFFSVGLYCILIRDRSGYFLYWLEIMLIF